MGFASYAEDIEEAITGSRFKGTHRRRRDGSTRRAGSIKPSVPPARKPDVVDEYWAVARQLSRHVLKAVDRLVAAETEVRRLQESISEENGLRRLAIAKFNVDWMDLEMGTGLSLEDWKPPRGANFHELKQRIVSEASSVDRATTHYGGLAKDIQEGVRVLSRVRLHANWVMGELAVDKRPAGEPNQLDAEIVDRAMQGASLFDRLMVDYEEALNRVEKALEDLANCKTMLEMLIDRL
jgi:hypothetical protein